MFRRECARVCEREGGGGREERQTDRQKKIDRQTDARPDGRTERQADIDRDTDKQRQKQREPSFICFVTHKQTRFQYLYTYAQKSAIESAHVSTNTKLDQRFITGMQAQAQH